MLLREGCGSTFVVHSPPRLGPYVGVRWSRLYARYCSLHHCEFLAPTLNCFSAAPVCVDVDIVRAATELTLAQTNAALLAILFSSVFIDKISAYASFDCIIWVRLAQLWYLLMLKRNLVGMQ